MSTDEPMTHLSFKGMSIALSLNELIICRDLKQKSCQNYCLVAAAPIIALIISIHAFWLSELLVCNNSLFTAKPL